MTQPVELPSPGEVPRTAPPIGGRRRRRRNTPTETAGIALAAMIGSLAALRWSDAAPTDIVVLDAVYRCALVVVLAVAGERARRWSLLLGSGLTAAFAVGPPRTVALVALATMLLLALVDRRSRVLDAAVGGMVGIGALALELPGPLGAETALAIAATGPILFTAYRYCTRRTQRRWRRALAGTAAGAAVATFAAVVSAGLAVGDVQDAVDATRAGVEAAGGGDNGAAAAAFDDAQQAFEAADGKVGAPWAAAARLVPGVGPNAAVLQDSVGLGVEITGAARNVASAVDFQGIQRLEGGVDLELLASFEAPVVEAADAADDAAQVLAGFDSSWIVGPLASRVSDLSDEVAELRSQTELARLGVEDGPAMLGADGERRYLLLLGNPSELRDMGGHLGNWAELVAREGSLELIDVGGPLELALPPEQAPVWVRDELPLSLSVLKPVEFPQNWGGDPDTSIMARLAGDLFEQRTGRTVHGVVYADTTAFAGFLRLTGPVQVPRLDPPYQLTADNAVAFLGRDQFTLFDLESDANAAVEAVIEEVVSRLTNSELPGPQALGELFSPIVAGGHLSLGTRVDADRPLVDRLGLSGEVVVPEGRDVLGVIQRNAGPNKIDSFLSRETDVALQWNPATGDVRSVVTVELRNDAPAQGFERLVIGNDANAPNGSNVTDVAVITPFMLEAARVDGSIVAAQPLLERDYWRHTVRVVVPPGGRRFVSFEMFGQVDAGNRYDLSWIGQPIQGDNTLDVSIVPAGDRARLVAAEGAEVTSDISEVDAGADFVFSWQSGNQN